MPPSSLRSGRTKGRRGERSGCACRASGGGALHGRLWAGRRRGPERIRPLVERPEPGGATERRLVERRSGRDGPLPGDRHGPRQWRRSRALPRPDHDLVAAPVRRAHAGRLGLVGRRVRAPRRGALDRSGVRRHRHVRGRDADPHPHRATGPQRRVRRPAVDALLRGGPLARHALPRTGGRLAPRRARPDHPPHLAGGGPGSRADRRLRRAVVGPVGEPRLRRPRRRPGRDERPHEAGGERPRGR